MIRSEWLAVQIQRTIVKDEYFYKEARQSSIERKYNLFSKNEEILIPLLSA